jgi:hypothetical protein
MRRVGTRSVLAVAACVAAAGCGGSGSSPASTASTASTAPAAPAAAGSTAAGLSARAIADRCGAQSAGNPSKLIVCLASSGVQLGDDVELYRCLQAAGNSTAVIACVQRAVR